jgi:N-acetylmuramate 1-kinase
LLLTLPHWIAREADEAALQRLAQLVSLKLTAGDVITLHGDLGAGKSTFARALVRAMLDDADAEVPSPTFSIIQTYDTLRVPIAHLDLYRLNSDDDLRELGIDDELARAAVIVEWPERAPSLSSPDRLDIALIEAASPDRRTLSITAHGTWHVRLERLIAISDFLDACPAWTAARIGYLQGDASARAYARLSDGSHHAILMDAPRAPDGPPLKNGLPYSRIAHLAEDVGSFVAIGQALRAAGLSAPEIYSADLQRGLLLLEDFGDRVFGRELEAGANQSDLWTFGVDTLLALRQVPVPQSIALPDGSHYQIPRLDHDSLSIEVALLPDWYWPAIKGSPIPDQAREEFKAAWAPIFERLLSLPTTWQLRDYHSPNLILLPDRHGAAKTGIIDFQDALQGPAAYDLVSLLQDARVTVPADVESALLSHYMERASADEPGFDRDSFGFAYAALGAQRNTKILGIFARLAKRDGKPGYLRHIPRLWDYMDRSLAHPDLAALRAWFSKHLPPESRSALVPAAAPSMARKKPAITTAMVLAAGLGNRMRPLTDTIPKPLVALGGKPMIDHALDRLQDAGISRAVVNVHYLADQIESHLEARSRPAIIISDERGVLLETGGGVVHALTMLGAAPFVIHNSDTVWIEHGPSNIARLIEAWDHNAMESLLLLAPRATSLGYDGRGDFHLRPDGQLVRRGDNESADYVFAGVSIATPALFNKAPVGRFSLNVLWDRAMASGRLHGLVLDGIWMHVGTMQSLTEAEALIAHHALADAGQPQ